MLTWALNNLYMPKSQHAWRSWFTRSTWKMAHLINMSNIMNGSWRWTLRKLLTSCNWIQLDNMPLITMLKESIRCDTFVKRNLETTEIVAASWNDKIEWLKARQNYLEIITMAPLALIRGIAKSTTTIKTVTELIKNQNFLPTQPET